MPTTTTSVFNVQPHRFTDALSKLAGRASAPDELSGGLDMAVTTAKQLADAFREIDWMTERMRHAAPEVQEILRRAALDAYDAWQAVERAGLPLLQAWQRDTLGYSEEEISR